MTKTSNLQELHDLKQSKRKEKFNDNALVQVAKGFWIFAEGQALFVLALVGLYLAHTGHIGPLPLWAQYALTVDGVLVLVPAAILLSKFFRSVGKS